MFLLFSETLLEVFESLGYSESNFEREDFELFSNVMESMF